MNIDQKLIELNSFCKANDKSLDDFLFIIGDVEQSSFYDFNSNKINTTY